MIVTNDLMDLLRHYLIPLSYIIAAFLFIFGLKMMGSPAKARKGNLISAVGMLIAVVVTLLDKNVIDFKWIGIGVLIGTVIGIITARRVAMTQMPEMVALFNGFGGLASLIVGWSAFILKAPVADAILQQTGWLVETTIVLSILIGGVTFTGSIVAWGKLAGFVSQKPMMFPGQRIVNLLLIVAILISGLFITHLGLMTNINDGYLFMGISGKMLLNYFFYGLIIASFLFGILSVIPIGGADMPVVISLLNSYSGLAACAAGFVMNNMILIVAGALVGASGIILTQIMCKAMNRSLANVLFSGFGSGKKSKSASIKGEVNPITAEDAFLILEAANSVVFVPGYGMAVSQAQHVVRELSEILEDNGADVKFAIHPVAGRMPGHMNVLLAEANVSYDKLVEPQDVNPIMETVDVAIIIGANDVVNPAAKEEKGSPIYGMPIIEAYHARTVFVIKRSMSSGFAGVDNPLFFKPNTRMIFGDAKEVVSTLIAGFKE